jgi:hypothetical protein
LLQRAARDETIANTLYWHVKLEKKNDENGEEMVDQYKSMYMDFMTQLQ